MKRASRIARLWAALAGLYFLVWLPVQADRMWFERLDSAVYWTIGLASLPLGLVWIVWAVSAVRRATPVVCFPLTVLYIVWWQLAVVAADAMIWDSLRANLARYGTGGLFLIGLGWAVWFVDRATKRIEARRTASRMEAAVVRGSEVEAEVVRGSPDPALPPDRRSPLTSGRPAVGEPAGSRDPRRTGGEPAGSGDQGSEHLVPRLRLGTHGLGGSAGRKRGRASGVLGHEAEPRNQGSLAICARIWNPLDPEAWYYGRRAQKLNQSLATFVTYTFVFVLVFLVLSQMRGCQEIYELPAGGGQQKTIAQTVKIQKIIRKKFVINPYSPILFEVPPIDEVKLNLNEATEHAYTVGYGAGTGAGFGGGTARGKVRLIRLEYDGGDWDTNFGIGGDMNMLVEYGIRTHHKVAEKTESRRISQLRNFPIGKSPPLVYMTGQKNISLSNTEVKILREYLLVKHGMLFADNCGSRHFHNQFLAMMNRVLPDIRPVPIPLDDVIHRVPYQIPFLPYVSPHGGKEALGWWKDGRWLCYYHPGDIADAWRDDHAGVKAEIWEACYQLGTNVIFYAHTEYSKWLEAQNKKR